MLASCGKEAIEVSDNQIDFDPASNLLQEYPDQYEKLQIRTIESNVVVPFKIPDYLLVPSAKEYFSLGIANYKYKGYNGKEAYVFSSALTDENFYVATKNQSGLTVLYIEVKPNAISVTSWNREIKVDYALAEDGQITKINHEYLSTLRADCDELGPREGGENFSDCFVRNWNNFCCDFAGCAAQIANGPAVAGGIAIACAVESVE